MAPPTWDSPAGLHIVERRSFAFWQLVTTALVALVLGMIIGYSGKKPGAATVHKGIISLPGLSAAGSATTVKGPMISVQSVSPGTRPSTTTTTSPATTAATSRVAVVLVPATTSHGPSDLQSFSVAGAWSVGWDFQCSNSPGGSAQFTITAIAAAGGPATTVVSETSRTDKGVTNEPPTVGNEHLHVATDPACVWIVKVTGVAG